ncbi:hypothetical protein DFR30_1847 [Thiogranum longum]|uniref:Mannitol repressor n=1 Tax=Thiogranum longum TaxID=1537524 RepID=A0A4R1HB23_9GAMM|nr:hypothetical protein [Thiogranum longum]TCK18568.1 hypothetical protein DFR30_1847 [Thiogranum longum]
MSKNKSHHLGKENWKSFFEEFMAESDRAAVVLGAAKLDLLLYQILERYLTPCPTGKDELLDGDSPLSTYSSKINLCFRLGLIDSQLSRTLHLVRRIRNNFAHEVSGCDLTSGAHKDRVRELCSPLKDFPIYKDVSEKASEEYDISGAPLDFRLSLAFASVALDKKLDTINTIGNDDPQPLITKRILNYESESS